MTTRPELEETRSGTDFLISDLHLQPSREDLCNLFSHFMQHIAPESQRLFILGDLFEYWIGDDATNDFTAWAESLLGAYSRSGRELFVGHGNRDFLLGQDFCRRTGATMLSLPTVCHVGGVRSVLTHGDELCTDDVEYQAFRKKVRDPLWIEQFLALPIEAREAFAREAREKSQTRQTPEPFSDIMDVNENAVAKTFADYQVDRIIHGHTHRQHVHRYKGAKEQRLRVVLGDWGDTGCYCHCAEGNVQLVNFTSP